MRQLAGVLREPKQPWRERFELLSQNLLARVPVAVLFDNFEDNLHDGAPAEGLAALLARWLQAPLKSRLVFTCRYPFSLTDDAHERLEAFHLGPLSWAETRKLFWRLGEEKPPNGKAKPLGLKWLSLEEQRGAYENVGGHPRALEYLDAILRGGKAQFDDVTIRLRKQLKTKGIADPARWCADTGSGLDAALAETVTLAADDVLLDQLLAQLADDPLCRRLLIGAAVYRVPVDELGLIWPVGEPVAHAADPARTARADDTGPLDATRNQNPPAGWADVFSKAELNQYRRDFAEANRSPVEAPAGFAAAKQRIMELSLLAPVRFADDEEETFLVHRWTAVALARRASEDEQMAAHQAAAAYWRWQFDTGRKSIQNLYEQRFHHHAAGNTEQAAYVAGSLCGVLDQWGAYEAVIRICRETLSWLNEDSRRYPQFCLQLGVTAQKQGLWKDATSHLRNALAIFQRQKDFLGSAQVLHELGLLQSFTGRIQEAEHCFHSALNVYRSLPADVLATYDCFRRKEIGAASCYAELGKLAQHRGDFIRAGDFIAQARLTFIRMGDSINEGRCHNSLGQLMAEQKQYTDAKSHFEKAAKIYGGLDIRPDLADAYVNLGGVEHYMRNLPEAFSWYKKAITIYEELGDMVKIPIIQYNLGAIAEASGDSDSALHWYEKASEKFSQTGQLDREAQVVSRIGKLYTRRSI